QYRSAIEDLARWSDLTVPDVAIAALTLVDGASHDRVIRDIGSFFIGPDRPRLEQALQAKVPVAERLRRRTRTLGWVAIAVPVGIITFLLVAFAFWALGSGPLGPVAVTALALLAMLPASEAATGLYNTMSTMLREPTRLVGYDFEDGIPARARTMVVVPCLLVSRDTIDDLVRNLEVH